MKTRHVIEILYTERCKHLALAVGRVRDALAGRRDDLDIELRLVLVSTFAEAVARRFRGSPTVRVDEDDVETRPGAIAPIGLLGRGYVVDGRVERAPTTASIRNALDLVAAEERARLTRERRSRASSSGVFEAAT